MFLTGDYAYKVKKPVKLPFLDFSTLELRRHFCEEELRAQPAPRAEALSRRRADRREAGAPRIGAEPTFEYAVKMRQFPDDGAARPAARRH